MAFRVVRTHAIDYDLEAIFDFIVTSCEALGEPVDAAFDMAERRIAAIEEAMARLAIAPFQGNLRPELGPDVRSVTKDRAIFYFDVGEETETLRILAVFFGGQDHDTAILLRLLRGE